MLNYVKKNWRLQHSYGEFNPSFTCHMFTGSHNVVIVRFQNANMPFILLTKLYCLVTCVEELANDSNSLCQYMCITVKANKSVWLYFTAWKHWLTHIVCKSQSPHVTKADRTSGLRRLWSSIHLSNSYDTYIPNMQSSTNCHSSYCYTRFTLLI